MMQHMCESCRRRTELYYIRCVDEYRCEDCAENAVETVREEEEEDD